MLKEKHYFAGNNTSKGFFSYFENIFNPEELNRIFILKGGPGVGKSSFIKKFAKKLSFLGYNIEYIHCSSDENSFDGIMVPELKISVIDGTAPHTIDPKLPSITDEIINLGEFLNHKELSKHKSQVIQINKKKSQFYKSAYRYLKCAGIVEEEISSIYDRLTDEKQFLMLVDEALNKIFEDKYNHLYDNFGKQKKLFSEAYTASGYVNFTDSFCEGKKVIAIIGESTNYIAKLLETIAKEAVMRGFDIECFYRPLTPEKMQHIIIPDLNLIIKSAENHMSCDYDEIINLHNILELENLKTHISEIENNLHLFDILINNAIEKLSEAKKYHELLEVIYVNGMNFKGIDEYFDKFFGSIII
ncbi:MAG: ATPase [Tissierellia bacterium]|nr:ATPase [Tissierellia bacterium]MDD4779506.1 ATPase [Tissierellia bacterium]